MTAVEKMTYAKAGVNIDEGNALVEKIKPLAKATSRSGVMGGIGGFGALFDTKAAGFKDPILVSTTDGVGTKLKLAQMIGTHDTIGIDLVAMCVNDLVVQGAQPLFFLDYFATGKLSLDVAEAVIKGIAEGCKKAQCALVGGETAEMPGMYADGEYDLAGFSVGAVERDAILPARDIAAGNILLGLSSSGIHSNGYSLVRKLVEKSGLKLSDAAPFDAEGKTLGESLLTPTRIYVRSCLSAIKTGGVKALAHITGGGFIDNIPRVIPDHLCVEIKRGSWQRPEIFSWMRQIGNMDDTEMLRTFNCGVGMVLVVEESKALTVQSVLESEGETVFTLGRLVAKKSDSMAEPVVFI